MSDISPITLRQYRRLTYVATVCALVCFLAALQQATNVLYGPELIFRTPSAVYTTPVTSSWPRSFIGMAVLMALIGLLRYPQSWVLFFLGLAVTVSGVAQIATSPVGGFVEAIPGGRSSGWLDVDWIRAMYVDPACLAARLVGACMFVTGLRVSWVTIMQPMTNRECPQCRYDLTDLTSLKCPECGAPLVARGEED